MTTNSANHFKYFVYWGNAAMPTILELHNSLEFTSTDNKSHILKWIEWLYDFCVCLGCIIVHDYMVKCVPVSN